MVICGEIVLLGYVSRRKITLVVMLKIFAVFGKINRELFDRKKKLDTEVFGVIVCHRITKKIMFTELIQVKLHYCD